ncbi:MAG TPA: bifunctional glycogen debranching protein GlgX/4-alpha-glucanotransferase [Methylomusa anaerophila]|uniref:4-alpha-glucanotransferase n=1 Tax=Methylomusa anaerophila TaxID=1930071 RepID=A0A348AH32_9FIRM|nr:bifunctional glycogen debranching protein GlgX/4-alpha-glucanotransferase [Methylomusa anaerophila]BBB90380.1 4-alpha-glucanotransferase [Methylomusa anaerophila]HML89273.1 bifunctional glycogen debranching protein GlgX/4-alpha-glucanotransferase [Methylomusa anaerophila]
MGYHAIMHDSQDLRYRSPFGAASCRSTITLRLSIDRQEFSATADAVILRTWRDRTGESLKVMVVTREEASGRQWYETSITAPDEPGHLWYYFIIRQGSQTYYYGNNSEELGGLGLITDSRPQSYQISVYRPEAKTPAWMKDAVIYQIFPDRFYNGSPDGRVMNPKPGSLLHASWQDTPVYTRDVETGAILAYDFFGGNLAGVIKKLPYLKELGITAIYFNPLFDAPSNHKYDTGDYKTIDPMFGDNALFAELCAQAQAMGIYVILDGVFSHTGSDSLYFNKEGNYPGVGAYQSPASPYYSWYRFSAYPDGYESWWGIDTLPNVNETDPSYIRYIIAAEDSVLKHWLRLGAKGWRLDVADELPSEFIARFRQALKEQDPDAVLIGEVWEDASRKVAYGELRQYFSGDHLDSVMNYPFRQTVLNFLLGCMDGETVQRVLMNLYENYPQENFYAAMNVIGTHDVPRILTLLGEAPAEVQQTKLAAFKHKLTPEQRSKGIARLKLAVLWQMTFPGAPCVYYGDEAGLEGYSDPLNRRPYPWGREDTRLVAWYKQMIALRHQYTVLRSGHWLPLLAQGDAYGYARRLTGGRDVFGRLVADNTAIVLLNRNPIETVHIDLDLNHLIGDQLYAYDLLNNDEKIPFTENGHLVLDLKPLAGMLLAADKEEHPRPGDRMSGVLLHPTSLPGRYGIGDLGDAAFQFVDFLQTAKQRLWQVLPLNPTGFGESPYQCPSAFAGNPLLLSPDRMIERGWLTRPEVDAAFAAEKFPDSYIDFARVKAWKERLFRQAFTRFRQQPKPESYQSFVTTHGDWLEDYALFMALRQRFAGGKWNLWDAAIAGRQAEARRQYKQELAGEIEYHFFLQYAFWQQWGELKTYANGKGIRLLGDLPLFVAHDSADVWAKPELFNLDKQGNPAAVAGVPPDYFSATGQLWGNPLYRWDVMAGDDYAWWRRRLEVIFTVVDIARMDHFRGLESYWEIPAGEKTAVKGRWVSGPGEKFFRVIGRYFENLPLIAEDLGVITPAVNRIKNQFAFPGMQVLQFGFGDGAAAPALPYNHSRNSVVYTGTHDNNTLLGWWREVQKDNLCLQNIVLDHLKQLHLGEDNSETGVCEQLVRLACMSRADTVILPLQDVLLLGGEARMNRPGTVGGNWRWRFREGDLTPAVAGRLAGWTEFGGRG